MHWRLKRFLKRSLLVHAIWITVVQLVGAYIDWNWYWLYEFLQTIPTDFETRLVVLFTPLCVAVISASYTIGFPSETEKTQLK